MHKSSHNSFTILTCLINISYGYTQQKIIQQWEAKGNPVVTRKYTCDPAALVQEKDMAAYAGYFSDPAHGLFMALSTDSYTY